MTKLLGGGGTPHVISWGYKAPYLHLHVNVAGHYPATC
jgi:hypothetical protein